MEKHTNVLDMEIGMCEETNKYAHNFKSKLLRGIPYGDAMCFTGAASQLHLEQCKDILILTRNTVCCANSRYRKPEVTQLEAVSNVFKCSRMNCICGRLCLCNGFSYENFLSSHFHTV
jgi:hypothetical protein